MRRILSTLALATTLALTTLALAGAVAPASAATWSDAIAPGAISAVVPFNPTDVHVYSTSGAPYAQYLAGNGWTWYQNTSPRASYNKTTRRFTNIGGVVVICYAWG